MLRGAVKDLDSSGALILEDNRVWRFAHLVFPKPPSPYGAAVRARLRRMYVGKTIWAIPSDAPTDRAGRQFVFPTSEGLGVRDVLLRGLARIRPQVSLYEIDDLFSAEWEARSQKRGLWEYEDYAVRSTDPNLLAQDMDSWQIVEGIVVDAQVRGGRTYLNFGSDYRTDFTVVVGEKIAAQMDEAPESLIGARIEVRGWIEMVNGPSIWLDNARALRVMD